MFYSDNKFLFYLIYLTKIAIGVEHVPGDMFIEVPKGDAILMKVSYIYTATECINYMLTYIEFHG